MIELDIKDLERRLESAWARIMAHEEELAQLKAQSKKCHCGNTPKMFPIKYT